MCLLTHSSTDEFVHESFKHEFRPRKIFMQVGGGEYFGGGGDPGKIPLSFNIQSITTDGNISIKIFTYVVGIL